MPERSVEDRLREEYFNLLPDIRRVAEQLETEVRYRVLPVSLKLDGHERLVVKSRIKECESAVEALRWRQEGATFDRDRPAQYTLTDLNDLAGVRVLGFPRGCLTQIDRELRGRFPSWTSDPVPADGGDEPLAFKYHGYCDDASRKVRGELQIVSMLTGLFWEVEHSAIYKPSPQLKVVARSLAMQERTQEVLKALRAFEEEFENLV
jgi:ppGpp synthetase/RelA/SpoT-type nucleotidyltranferase